MPLAPVSPGESGFDPPGRERTPSSVLGSAERRELEAVALAAAMSEQIERWRQREEWQKLQCAELLLVAGWSNKRVAAELGMSEQAVANQKFELLDRLRNSLRRQRLSTELFPELHESH